VRVPLVVVEVTHVRMSIGRSSLGGGPKRGLYIYMTKYLSFNPQIYAICSVHGPTF